MQTIGRKYSGPSRDWTDHCDSHVFPRSPVGDFSDTRTLDIEPCGNLGLCDTRFEQSLDLAYHIQTSAARVERPAQGRDPSPALFIPVKHIGSVRADEEMFRIAARWVVASMKDMGPDRIAVYKGPCEPVSKEHFAVNAYATVSTDFLHRPFPAPSRGNGAASLKFIDGPIGLSHSAGIPQC